MVPILRGIQDTNIFTPMVLTVKSKVMYLCLNYSLWHVYVMTGSLVESFE